MTFWVLTVFKLVDKLEALQSNLDRRIMDVAAEPGGDAMKDCEKVLALNDKKRLLANLKVMYDTFLEALDDEERYIILFYSKGRALEAIAGESGISRSAIYRKLNKAVRKCVAALEELGFNNNGIVREYGEFAPVYRTFVKVRREHFARQTAVLSQFRDCGVRAYAPAPF